MIPYHWVLSSEAMQQFFVCFSRMGYPDLEMTGVQKKQKDN